MDLRDNKEFMMAAVTQNGRALEYASKALQRHCVGSSDTERSYTDIRQHGSAG